MKAASAIGIGIAVVCIIIAGIMEGVAPPMLLNINALIIVLGGTAGAVLGGVGMKRFMLIPKLYMKAILSDHPDMGARVKTLVSFAERARKDGLLALEEEIEAIEEPFMRKGMQLIVDGTDPDLLREILDSEIDAMAARHKQGSSVFEKAGGLAPTIGVLGTVISLVARALEPVRPRDARPVHLRRRSSRRCTAWARPTSCTCPSATRCRC